MDLICCVSQALPPLSPVFYRHFFPFVREAGSLSPQLLIQIQSQIVSVNYLSVSLLSLRLQLRKSSVCSIDPRLSVALLLHQDLSIDKPGVVLFPPKWGGRSGGLEGTPRSLQTRGTVLIGIYEQYFSLCKVNLGLGKFYCCWYGNGFNDGFELKHSACLTFL